MTEAVQLLWNAETMIREPLQVKFPFLTAPGKSNTMDVLHILSSLRSRPPVQTHTAVISEEAKLHLPPPSSSPKPCVEYPFARSRQLLCQQASDCTMYMDGSHNWLTLGCLSLFRSQLCMTCTAAGQICKFLIATHPVASQGIQQEFLIVILMMQPSWKLLLYLLTFEVCWGRAVTTE